MGSCQTVGKRRNFFLPCPPSPFLSIGFHSTLFRAGSEKPHTGAGKLIGAFCAIFGVFTIILPIPIVVNRFSGFYKNRLWRNEVAAKKKDRLLSGGIIPAQEFKMDGVAGGVELNGLPT